MNEEDKIIINSFKFYDRDELEDLTKEYYLENQQLKEQLQQKEYIINKAKDLIESYYDFMEEKYDFKYFDGYKLLEILSIDKGE